MVGARQGDGLDEVVEIEVMSREIFGEGVEERFVRGGVGGAEIVDGFNEAAAEEHAPHAVGHGAGEVGVLFRGDPVGEQLATIR